VTGLGDEGEELVRDPGSEDLAGLERQLERRAPEMSDQDVEVVRIETGLFGSGTEQELRMPDDIPVERRGRGVADRVSRPSKTNSAEELLRVRPGG
jgi:hypothetical protein